MPSRTDIQRQMSKKSTQARELLAETASSYIGLTARPNTNQFLTQYARLSGNWQWDGIFVDYVLDQTLKQLGLSSNKSYLPDHRDVSAALSFYIRSGLLRTPARTSARTSQPGVLSWLRAAPAPGDIAFFAYSTQETGSTAFLSSRAAVITSAEHWREHGALQVVEGNINSGQPRGSQEWNGVFERTRYASDLIGYVKIPSWMLRPAKPAGAGELPSNISYEVTVRPALLQRCASSATSKTASAEARKATETVQLALAAHPASNLRNADRAVFNAKTRAALAAYQRFIGLPSEKCDGSPDVFTLQQLAASPYLRSAKSWRSWKSWTSVMRRRRALTVPTFEVRN